MQTTRTIAHAPRSVALSQDIAAMPQTCVGCDGCQGICAALIEAMTLPDVVLKGRNA